jgi:predicted protein tyrosine phosphatase
MAIIITDRSGAGKILCSPRRRSDIAYVVSIGGPAERPPAGWQVAVGRLRLVFEDCLSESEGGPSTEHIARLIWFARQVDLTRGTVLVHCEAGISRSVAAAAILLAVARGPGQEAAALGEALCAQPEGRPNQRMLELADEALGNGGALVRAWRAVGESGHRTSG